MALANLRYINALNNNKGKEEKYANIGSQYLFAPIAVETLGPLNTSACQLFGNLGTKISSSSGDDSFSVPKSFGASAALQRCLVT